jgi:hypothetical protein
MRLQGSSSERIQTGTKQRVIACRRRLRRSRAMQKVMGGSLSLARFETSDLLVSVSGSYPEDAENILTEPGAGAQQTACRFAQEVDRRAALRAR